jgi:hypothetical protein
VKLRGIMCLIALTSLVLSGCTSIPAATLDAYAAGDILTVKASAAWMTTARIDTAPLPRGTILLFTTAEGNLGKMLIVTGSRQSPMQFMYTVYKADGSILKESKKASVAQTYAFDFESNSPGPVPGTRDFWWQWTEFDGGGRPGDPVYLVPQPGSKFHVYLTEPPQ